MSDEERIKAENRKLRKEKSEIQMRQEKVIKLEKELDEVKTSMKTILKEIVKKTES